MAFKRIFNGQAYHAWRRHDNKSDAIRDANRIRAKGGKARVVPTSKTVRAKTGLRWEVFAKGS